MSKARPRPVSSKPGSRRPVVPCASTDAIRAASFHLLPWGCSAKADWTGCDDPGFHATARQQALMDMVEDVIAGGQPDPNLIALEVGLRLGCSDADIVCSRVNIGVDGETGFFYEDFLYAVFTLRAQEADRLFHGLMDRLLQPRSFPELRLPPR